MSEEVLGFIEAAATYLADMAERGDAHALYLCLKANELIEKEQDHENSDTGR